MVWDAKERFKAVCWHRRARKTTMSLNMLIESCCANRNQTYGYVAPTYKQAKSIAVVDPMMFKRYVPPEVCAKPFNESELRQAFRTGCVLEMKGADDPDSIRGVGWKGVVLEEWATMPYGRIIWEEILQPILRENDGWAMFIYTPKGKNFAYEYFERAKQDASGDWMWSLLRASESGIIPQIELEKARVEMPERLYNQEFECSFLEDASSVFHNVDRCIQGDELHAGLPGRKYILGVDLGKTNDFTVLIPIDIGNGRIATVERFNELSWAIQRERIVLMAKRFNNAQIIIDSSGFSAGDVIAEDLLDHPLIKDLKMAQLSVLPFKFTNPSKRALVEKLIICIEQQLITFPGIEQLISELKAFTYDVTEFGNIRYTAPEGMHDDCVIALGLALWGVGSNVYAPLRKLTEKPSDPRLVVRDYKRQERPRRESLATWR